MYRTSQNNAPQGIFSVHGGWDGGEGGKVVSLNLDVISFSNLSQVNDLLGAIYSLWLHHTACGILVP